MLEKIGLPAKPSLRGNTWVVDASHCQGCSSQFTFINRKHHCRRCGGLFCNSCTQQRMVLRGQGDSPVRTCEPCKKLEEAARFELRHGHKNRAPKGSSKMAAKHEDDVLMEILGADADISSSSGSASSMSRISHKPKASSSVSFPNVTETARNDGTELQLEIGSASPEELRRQAMEEKKKYRVLKGEGKSEEALRAFKRGKELEKQAEALETSLRRNRKRVLSSEKGTVLGNVAEAQSNGAVEESSKTLKPARHGGKEKDDFAAELMELGWSDDEDKKPANLSLEGEFSSLLREVPMRTSQEKGHGIDMTKVIVLKKKALLLKREGKLAEAKEELKRAKVLERQLEEQELLAGAEDSDDELSAIIRSMDDKEEDLLGQNEQRHDFDIGNLLGTVNDLGVRGDFDVTDEDMVDPEIAAALKSLGWTEASGQSDSTGPQPAPTNREGCLVEIQSLKREALNLKRAGNVAEAMATLKKAKLLEKELEAADMSSKAVDMAGGNYSAQRDLGLKPASKSRLAIQKELLAVKKKALALRREGRFDEAEGELNKGTVLQNQLDELDNSSKLAALGMPGRQKEDLANELPDNSRNSLDDDGEVDVTDQDLDDPKYLSLLRSLGWNEEDNKPTGFSSETSNLVGSHGKIIETQGADDSLGAVPRRSKAEIQRELLGLKRKALALRRQGSADEAEEVLRQTKVLEDQMMEIDSGKKLQADRNQLKKKSIDFSAESRVDEGDDDVTEKDMKDPALLSVLKNLGWEDEEPPSLPLHERPLNQATSSSMQSSSPSVAAKSKGQIQRELLDLKRKALALRRKGETEEAEELLRKANTLEAQMAELEAPKNEPMLDASRVGSSMKNVSLANHGSHQNAVNEVRVSTVSTVHDASGDRKLENKDSLPAVNSPNYMDVDLLAGFGRKEAKTDDCLLGNDNVSIPSTSQFAQDNYPLFGEFIPSDEAGAPSKLGMDESGITSQPGQHGRMMDLLTGDYGERSQIPAGKTKDETKSDFALSSLSIPSFQIGSLATSGSEAQSNLTTEKIVLHGDLKPDNYQASSVQNVSTQDSQHSLRQEIQALKRKAVALKREGKLVEAKDALRQAKLLERSLEGEDNPPKNLGSDDAVSSMQASSAGQKENSPSSSAPKALSGRDRFKLQQESLSHKRQALKLRREGRLQEAEAEFELAKTLEVQLEESTSRESSRSEPVDDAVVEDFLDPQLLSALKAIGLDNAIAPSRSPEKLGLAKASPEAVKSNPAKESPNQERMQLEERIKAEKVKAVTLKRAGKQAEALDALRRAKLYEKKLNALSSN